MYQTNSHILIKKKLLHFYKNLNVKQNLHNFYTATSKTRIFENFVECLSDFFSDVL